MSCFTVSSFISFLYRTWQIWEDCQSKYTKHQWRLYTVFAWAQTIMGDIGILFLTPGLTQGLKVHFAHYIYTQFATREEKSILAIAPKYNPVHRWVKEVLRWQLVGYSEVNFRWGIHSVGGLCDVVSNSVGVGSICGGSAPSRRVRGEWK